VPALIVRGRNDKELLIGLIFLVISLSWIWSARIYPIGSATRMGPGYFPTMVGIVLAVLGGVNVLRGLRSTTPERVRRLSLRPLLMLFAGVVLFGLLIDRCGLLIAIAALVIFCCLAGPRFRLWEAGAILTALMVLAGALFIFGLDLPFTYLLPH
jgi:Tripartite tricarboxylate transporter TctB family